MLKRVGSALKGKAPPLKMFDFFGLEMAYPSAFLCKMRATAGSTSNSAIAERPRCRVG